MAEEGYVGDKTILDDYLRELRPLYLPRPRTFRRTAYRPGALCQFDLWEPSSDVPVGHGQTQRTLALIQDLGLLAQLLQRPPLHLRGRAWRTSVSPWLTRSRRGVT